MDNGHDLNRWWFRLLNPSCLNRRLHLILSRRAALHPVTQSSTRSAPCWTRSSTRVTRPLYPRAASTRPRFVSSVNHWHWNIIMTKKMFRVSVNDEFFHFSSYRKMLASVTGTTRDPWPPHLSSSPSSGLCSRESWNSARIRYTIFWGENCQVFSSSLSS